MDDYDADAAFARRLIEFDADDPATHSPWTLTTGVVSGKGEVASEANRAIRAAAAVKPIPWPAGLTPTPQPMAPAPQPSDALPVCDYPAVTWTVAEAKALASNFQMRFASAFFPCGHTGPFGHRIADKYLRALSSVENRCMMSSSVRFFGVGISSVFMPKTRHTANLSQVHNPK